VKEPGNASARSVVFTRHRSCTPLTDGPALFRNVYSAPRMPGAKPPMGEAAAGGRAGAAAVTHVTRVYVLLDTAHGTPPNHTATLGPEPSAAGPLGSCGKPRPVRVTSVPPAREPEAGETPLSSG
jgi:hypothetical protein